MNIADTILKLSTSITACYVSIITALRCVVTIFWLNCQNIFWSRKWDSNSRSPAPKAGALSRTKLHRDKKKNLTVSTMSQRVRPCCLERGKRIELSASAWKAEVLPLYEPRIKNDILLILLYTICQGEIHLTVIHLRPGDLLKEMLKVSSWTTWSNFHLLLYHSYRIRIE